MSNTNLATVNFLSEHTSDKENLFEKDIWTAKELGIVANTPHSMYQLNFNKIKHLWLRKIVKRFMFYQASTRSISTCRTYIISF